MLFQKNIRRLNSNDKHFQSLSWLILHYWKQRFRTSNLFRSEQQNSKATWQNNQCTNKNKSLLLDKMARIILICSIAFKIDHRIEQQDSWKFVLKLTDLWLTNRKLQQWNSKHIWQYLYNSSLIGVIHSFYFKIATLHRHWFVQ